MMLYLSFTFLNQSFLPYYGNYLFLCVMLLYLYYCFWVEFRLDLVRARIYPVFLMSRLALLLHLAWGRREQEHDS
jgi:hypothetical protein